jgi:hypothetical protein
MARLLPLAVPIAVVGAFVLLGNEPLFSDQSGGKSRFLK